MLVSCFRIQPYIFSKCFDLDFISLFIEQDDPFQNNIATTLQIFFHFTENIYPFFGKKKSSRFSMHNLKEIFQMSLLKVHIKMAQIVGGNGNGSTKY